MIIASDIALIAALWVFVVPTDASVPGKRAHDSLSPTAPPAPAPTIIPVTTPRASPTAETPSRADVTSSPPSERTTVAVTSPPDPGPSASHDAPAPPAASPTTTSSVPPNLTGVETEVEQTSEYLLDIPFIGLYEPVISGGQDEIDQGSVTAVDWSSEGYPASCLPGDGCTVWLAGHRTTNDAVFARVPELAAGAAVQIHFRGQTYTYTVTESVTVPGSSPPSVIVGDLVLQTSAPGDQRVLIYAEATAP